MILNLPECFSVTISHNAHNVVYETAAEYLKDESPFVFISDEDRKACFVQNEIWEIDLYPISPVGHFTVIASTLELAYWKMWEIALGMEVDENMKAVILSND